MNVKEWSQPYSSCVKNAYNPAMALDTMTQVSTRGRTAFGATAILAAFGMVLNLALSALGTYPSTQTVPSLLGFNDSGSAGAPGRILDFLSYFTVLSNIIVAVVMAMLWRNPARSGARCRLRRSRGNTARRNGRPLPKPVR